jgi:hypothetical protein
VAYDNEELLVIVSNDVAGSGGTVFPDRFPIVHAASSRVFVIKLPADASSGDVATLPGVTAVTRGGSTPEILEGLEEMEALFVRAWSKRKEESATQRRGEGLDWDADGFEPPDPPPGIEVNDQSA